MKGIQYVTDEKGKRKAVILDLEIHGTTLEDYFDNLTFNERKDELTIPFEEAVEQLKKEGKYSGK